MTVKQFAEENKSVVLSVTENNGMLADVTTSNCMIAKRCWYLDEEIKTVEETKENKVVDFKIILK